MFTFIPIHAVRQRTTNYSQKNQKLKWWRKRERKGDKGIYFHHIMACIFLSHFYLYAHMLKSLFPSSRFISERLHIRISNAMQQIHHTFTNNSSYFKLLIKINFFNFFFFFATKRSHDILLKFREFRPNIIFLQAGPQNISSSWALEEYPSYYAPVHRLLHILTWFLSDWNLIRIYLILINLFKYI